MAGVIEILATLPTSPFSTSCRIYEKQTTHFKKSPCFKNNEENCSENNTTEKYVLRLDLLLVFVLTHTMWCEQSSPR